MSLSALDAIRTRRAIKHYEAGHPMPEADRKLLFELAQQTPSSFNIQHWRFVDVTDTALRAELRAAAWGQAQVTDASMLLVLCADVKAWEKNPDRYWQNAPEEARKMLVGMLRQFYDGRPQMQHDEAMRSVGLVAQTLMLSAKAIGYDSSPMVGFDFDKVGALINLPKDHVIGMMLAIGKAAKPANAKGGYLPLSEIVIENRF